MQLLEIPFAVFGLICAVVIVFALFQKVEDPKERLRQQHLERWGNKP
jgi:hypothetical protein